MNSTSRSDPPNVQLLTWVAALNKNISVDTFDLDAIDAQSLKLMQWADSETEWLDAHPSDPCYAETQRSWSRVVALVGQWAKLNREAIAEDDDSKIMQGTEVLVLANAEALKLADFIPLSDAACGT